MYITHQPRARVQDRVALAAVSPAELASYLRANGWTLLQGGAANTALFRKAAVDGGEAFETDIPLRQDFGDYPQRVAELLHNLEVVEGRSQLDILRDLQASAVDVVR